MYVWFRHLIRLFNIAHMHSMQEKNIMHYIYLYLYKFYKFGSIIVFIFTYLSPGYSYATEQQQALQQLRMLQQQINQPPAVASKAQTARDEHATTTNQPPAPPQMPPQVAPPNQNINAPREVNDVNNDNSNNDFIEQQAFSGMTKQLFPLNSEEIIKLKQLYHTSEYAQTSSAGTPPKPTATSQFVNLSPGSTPPVIRLSQGFVSSLVFLDSTGSPWPISAYDLGDPAAFNIQWDKTGNTLMIQSLKLYTYGNLAVRLRNLNTPVMLTLIPGQKAVDYRVDLRVQGYGPNAKIISHDGVLPPSASDILLHVLDGVPPAGSRRLSVSGGDARAWLLNEKMYIRTNLTILSPAWLESMTSADGMHAYEMQKSPVLLVSWHGKVMQLKIEGL